jgi:hypothetical protein
VKINAVLEIGKVLEVKQLLKEFKDVFAWTYKDLKGIPIICAYIVITYEHVKSYIIIFGEIKSCT